MVGDLDAFLISLMEFCNTVDSIPRSSTMLLLSDTPM